MNDHTPAVQGTPPDPDQDQLPTDPDPQPAPGATTRKTRAAATAEAPERFAQYDLDHLRYVGKVHDTKAAASAAGKDAGRTGRRYEIRKV